jgi:hypothetical protein
MNQDQKQIFIYSLFTLIGFALGLIFAYYNEKIALIAG